MIRNFKIKQIRISRLPYMVLAKSGNQVKLIFHGTKSISYSEEISV